jgi:hypothetical protein
MPTNSAVAQPMIAIVVELARGPADAQCSRVHATSRRSFTPREKDRVPSCDIRARHSQLAPHAGPSGSVFTLKTGSLFSLGSNPWIQQEFARRWDDEIARASGN